MDKTELIWAAKFNNADKIKKLIENGADIEAKDEHGCTALVYAAQFNNTDAVITLIENGADIGAKNKDGWGPLRYTAQFYNKKAIITILEKCTDVETKDNYGWAAIVSAVKHKCSGIINLLNQIQNQEVKQRILESVNKTNL